MAITIKNNTTKLQNLKNKVNALPDKEEGGGTIVLDQTTVSPADVLVNKTYYYADANGQPVKSTGEMNNWGEINVEVGLNGTGQDARYGYITGVRATFAEEVNNEINTQADLIAQIKGVLNNKASSSTTWEEIPNGTILNMRENRVIYIKVKDTSNVSGLYLRCDLDNIHFTNDFNYELGFVLQDEWKEEQTYGVKIDDDNMIYAFDIYRLWQGYTMDPIDEGYIEETMIYYTNGNVCLVKKV